MIQNASTFGVKTLSQPDAGTGVPRSLENAPPKDLTVGLCLGTYGSPRGGGLYELGTHVEV